MRRSTIAIACRAASAALGLLRMPPEGADNPYGLPTGEPIRLEMIRWFNRQMRAMLGTIPKAGTELPTALAWPYEEWDRPMAQAMTPILSPYWKESGQETMGRLAIAAGLDEAPEWSVTNPKLRGMIEEQAFRFCQATNRTTKLQLNQALEMLKQELIQGLVDKGETLPELTKRVRSIFTEAKESRAKRIAWTEASRAVHAAQAVAAAESGVVAGFRWLLSTDACPACHAVATKVNQVPIGGAFADTGGNPYYSTVKFPPLHPHCNCSMTEILLPEYGGPEAPEWGETLADPGGDEA